ncbi:CMP-sialic acid synthase isoform X2 [Brevipalpus obovatus]|uniref:CMP-sialic acid synthase isoform X2 n=1 Tax=Brevipalpus obovatus TaxID=246614 RepID=UPI003D9F668D
MKHVALVLARSKSQSIVNKNLLMINHEPLISYSLRVLAKCEFFSEFWVSTDSKEIATIAEKIAPKVGVHFRSKQMSSSVTSSLDSTKDFLATREDVLYLVQCTSPVQRKSLFRKACQMMEEEESKWDSIFSVTRSHNLRWTHDSDGHLVPLNFDSSCRPRRQDWQGELIETGHFYAARRTLIMAQNLLQSGQRCAFVEFPSSICMELDEPWQIPFIELMVAKYYTDDDEREDCIEKS